jgi:hypothetical protein
MPEQQFDRGKAKKTLMKLQQQQQQCAEEQYRVEVIK